MGCASLKARCTGSVTLRPRTVFSRGRFDHIENMAPSRTWPIKKHGPSRNMAIVRHFAPCLVAANKYQGSVKTKRKSAGWSQRYRLELRQLKTALIWIIAPVWPDGMTASGRNSTNTENAIMRVLVHEPWRS
jgi:hypothetical protein